LLPFCSFTVHVFATDSDNQPKWKLEDFNTNKPIYIIHNDKLIGIFDASIIDFKIHAMFKKKIYFKNKKQESWSELKRGVGNLFSFVHSLSKEDAPMGVYIKTGIIISDSFLPSGEIPRETETGKIRTERTEAERTETERTETERTEAERREAERRETERRETERRETERRETERRETERTETRLWLLPVGICIGVIVTLGIEASIRYIRTRKKNIRYQKNKQRSKKLH